MRFFKFVFSFVGLTTLLATSVARAEPAAPVFDTVPALSIKNLEGCKGQYLTIAYVVAAKKMVHVNDREVEVAEIKNIVTQPINSDVAFASSLEIPIVGFMQGYNHVILIAHKQPVFTWMNGDRSVPKDPRDVQMTPETRRMTFVYAINKGEIEAARKRFGETVTVGVPMVRAGACQVEDAR